jgi:hypothetical protein
VRKGGGFNYFCLNWGRPQTEKYVTRGAPNFLILSYLLIFKVFKLFLVIEVGVNNNHFEYWSPLTCHILTLLILHQKM